MGVPVIEEGEKLIPIVIGVAVGALAHFGRMISESGCPAPKTVIGFVMQLGLVALVAAVIAERMQFESDLIKCLTAAVLTIATNEVVNWLRDRAKRVMDKGLDL